MISTFKLEKSYQKLFYAGIINGIGDRFSQVALLTLILQITESGLAVGITLALRMLPFLLFGPISSILARKLSRKKLLIYTDVFRACIAISFLFIDSPNDVWIIYVGSFLLAGGEALYSPTRRASIPAIVQKKHIKTINSWEQVLLGFVLVIGALAGGFVSYLFGPSQSFLVNIFSFFIASVFISKIPSLEAIQNEKEQHCMKEYQRAPFFFIIFSSSFLMMLLSTDLLIPLANGMENVLISVYAVQTFQAADLGVGILYGVLGIGFLISPLLTKRITKHYLLSAFLCIFIEGILLITVSRSPSFSIVVLLFGVLTIFGGISNTLLDTVVMQSVPESQQGMYFGLSETISNTMLGISMFFTGILLESFSPRTIGAINGGLYVLLALMYIILTLTLTNKKQHLQKAANE
ncbi:MFS transporter [Niallia sp. NCCP-28]|uniref:MFS transporter n=1 Tax=Niallia sp. NCCP-28 TaxID=2934712 RepID=UPI002084F3F6|nr:MFS transporter [Niallia sp. NCCP-28]GKU82169.1 MFS transporter [Niallia sp. NCCP-28]